MGYSGRRDHGRPSRVVVINFWGITLQRPKQTLQSTMDAHAGVLHNCFGVYFATVLSDGKATGIRALKYELAKFVDHMQSHLMLSEDAVFQIQIPVL